MFNHYYKAASIVLLGMLSVTTQADDLDIYAGATVTGTATPELIFAIDTSRSMSCALDQEPFRDAEKCFANANQRRIEELISSSGTINDISDIYSNLGIEGYVIPDNVKINLVREVMGSVLAEGGELSDDVKVGLAFYNDPGGAIVQPLKALGDSTGYAGYSDHRGLLMAELNNVVPNGKTPIMGTLLEIGQYLNSGQVINGKQRMPAEDLESAGYSDGGTPYLIGYGLKYGQTARTSHPQTVTEESLAYFAEEACQAQIEAEVVLGKSHIACISESLGLVGDVSPPVFYNEDINRASVCGNNAEQADGLATTQVVLLSDGLAFGERLNFEAEGASMATWVRRFVTADRDATGVITAGEVFDQSADDFPESARFTDLGCPETAYSNGDSTEKQQYESCLANIANRFRELDVKVNVIGFAIDDDDFDVNNNYLRKIAEITGGDFRYTNDVGELQSFIVNLASGAVAASRLSVPLSPSVAVNPGSILTNSGEVYIPGFQSGDSSFYYGNLKKYEVEVRAATTDAEGNATSYETVLVGANGDATEECQIGDDENNVYTCFKSDVRDFWASAAPQGVDRNYAAVTVGGAAAEQGVFGPDPTDGRKVFIQNGKDSHELKQLNLISIDGNADYGTPDEDALHLTVDEVDIATKNYYAQLVEDPGSPGSYFASFNALQAAIDGGATGLLSNNFSHDLIRWLSGVDQNRFNSEGGYTSIGDQNERALLGANAPVVNASEDLSKSRLYYGAIVHSSPTLVNYSFDRTDDGLVYDNTIFVSGNDGFLRAVDASDGTEHFSFFPEALIPNLAAWYQNSPGKMVYGLDSTWTAWRQDLPNDSGVFDGQISGGDGLGFVRLYGGMRRGGSSYYFLDVSNLNQPKLLREINPEDEHFERLGQTWSQPVLARIKKPGDSFPTVVAVFGGGYDPDNDSEYSETAPIHSNPNCIDTAEEENICGNQIYMVKAGGYTGGPGDETGIGDSVWWASNDGPSVDFSPGATMYSAVDNMNHSIPSKVKTIDIDDDGYTDRIYVGDLGGQVFRIKINNHITNADSPEAQFITIDTLAQVGHEGFVVQSEANDRMFFEAPSVAVMKNNNRRYIGVAIASGWRPNPSDDTVQEELYFFRDELAGNEDIIQRPSPAGTEGNDDFILGAQAFTGTAAQLDAAKALAVSLNSDDDNAGEKAFGSPIILRSNVFLPIYIPPTSTELETSLTQCEPPPHRSALVGFRVQSDAEVSFVNNDGNIVAGTPPEGNVASFFRSSGVRSVPFNGLGVHVGNDTVSILAGTESITLSLPDDRVRKTRWELLESGQDAIDQLENPVSGPE